MKISVIIPCHNGEAFLAQTLESVLNQTARPAEIIVVDDGSEDGSLALARRYALSHGECVRTLAGRYGGASATRNAGAAVADGDALMFLDADDLLGPTVLQSLSDVLARHPAAIACCPWYRLEEVAGCWLSRPPSCAPRRPGQDALSAWLCGCYYPPCSVLWSRPAYERGGGWDPKVRVNTDGEIMMRALISGIPLVPTAEGTSYYRRLPDGGISLSATRTTRAGIESRLLVTDKIAGLIDEAGLTSRYRAPLAEAYGIIADDCRELFPDLHEASRTAAERLAGPPRRYRAHAIAGRPRSALARIRRRFDRAIGIELPPPAAGAGRQGRAPSVVGQSSESSEPRPHSGDHRHPRVSVVVPVFNRADLLPRALDSVLTQSYADYELLVVDDGSTDDTPAVVAGYSDPRLRYLRQEANRGVGAARNRGLREARGDFIAFLDSDDEWLPCKLRRQVSAFESLPDSVGLVYTGVETVDATGRRHIERLGHGGHLHEVLLRRNVLHGAPSSGMIRRSVVAMIGYFDEQLPAIEDYDYWLRLARFYRIEFIDEVLIRYHDPTTGDDERDGRRRSLNFAANLDARLAFYHRNRHEMERAGVDHLFLLDSARRHLESPFGDPQAARRLAAMALLRRPGCLASYPLLLPRRTRATLRYCVSGLRSLFGPRSRLANAGKS